MAVPTMAEMIGTYQFTEADMTEVVDFNGIRGDAFLNQMAPYSPGGNTVPTPISEYSALYTLDTAAKVNSVLNFLGPRGPSVFEQMLLRAA